MSIFPGFGRWCEGCKKNVDDTRQNPHVCKLEELNKKLRWKKLKRKHKIGQQLDWWRYD